MGSDCGILVRCALRRCEYYVRIHPILAAQFGIQSTKDWREGGLLIQDVSGIGMRKHSSTVISFLVRTDCGLPRLLSHVIAPERATLAANASNWVTSPFRYSITASRSPAAHNYGAPAPLMSDRVLPSFSVTAFTLPCRPAPASALSRPR